MALLSDFLTSRRHARIAPFLRGDVLDLGCGDARALELHSARIASYCGVERDPSHVDALRAKHPNATFICRDLDRDRLNLARHFDCVLMTAIVEHLFNQKFVMLQVAEVLKRGGRVLITTPSPFGNDLVHRGGAALGLFARSAVDDHIVIYNRHRFRILAREVHLELETHRYFQIFCNQLAVLIKR